MGRLNSTPDIEYLFSHLAVVKRASRATLETLLSTPVPDAGWLALSRQPRVTEKPDHLVLSAAAAEKHLAWLEQNDGPHYRLIHQRALDLLAQQLSAGDTAAEPILIQIFRRLADHLLAERVGGFEPLVASAQQWSCQMESSVQWRRYYQGVLEFEQGHYDAALFCFDELLAQNLLDRCLRGRILNSRALYYRVKGRYEDALKGFQESLQIWQTLGDGKSAGKALLNMGDRKSVV